MCLVRQLDIQNVDHLQGIFSGVKAALKNTQAANVFGGEFKCLK